MTENLNKTPIDHFASETSILFATKWIYVYDHLNLNRAKASSEDTSLKQLIVNAIKNTTPTKNTTV